MIYHIVVGDMAATPLLEAINAEPSMAGEVVVMKDILHIGPLKRGEGQSFSALRSEWWQQVAPNEKDPIQVQDMERLLEISNELYKDADAQVWFWMALTPADVVAYHWMLPYLAKHIGRFYLVNIANLPFLDEGGKVYYPKSLSAILPRELIKARKLARAVTPAEAEMDSDTWTRLVDENAGIRTHDGGKKLSSQPEDFYDSKLLAFCTAAFTKASRILHTAMAKEALPTGDIHLAWRLCQLASTQKLELQGDPSKSYKDWEVRLPQTTSESAELSTNTQS